MAQKRLFFKSGTDALDALLYEMSVKNVGVAQPFREGDLIKGGATAYPILRDNALRLDLRTSGGNMTLKFSYNDVLKNNPVIGIIGSSHSVSTGLSGAQTLQAKIQAYMNADHGGATIHNLGVAGGYTDQWLPTSLGGMSDRNIDAIRAFNPDFIILIGPTNDAVQNTPAEATANLQIISDYARVPIFIHSPLLRGDYNAGDIADLEEENVLWRAAFPYKYLPLFELFPDPNSADFQSDHIHLSDQGTTKQCNAIMPVIERELRAITAYTEYIVERSTDNVTWALFDTIIDPQIVRKTYVTQTGSYRVSAKIKDGTYLAMSNVESIGNQAPTANAGADKTLAAGTTSVVVNGSGADADGTIVSYLWEVVSGSGLTLVNASTADVTVNGMADGLSYVLRLTVTDNLGATGVDTMAISVQTAGNTNPVANAGPDQDLVLGSTSVSLDGSGSDSDGTITAYQWTFISGPNTPVITTPTLQDTTVTGMIGGVYVFRLTVTDDDSATANDDVRVRIVSKIMRVMLSKTAATTVPAGWLNLAADPVAGAPTITDTGGSNFTFRSRGEANFNHSIGPSNAQNDWGQGVDLGAGYFSGWPAAVVANYWYNPFDNFTTGRYQGEFAGLDPNKDGRIKAISSRSNANGATGPFSTRYNINWLAGNTQIDITVAFQNTISGITSTGRPLGDGTLPVAFNIGATGSVAHLNAISYEEF